ncbi:MAG TPA: SBBP repeat-containing protein [Microbacterium sp.]|nr:SBBP repeat-containing protein [Microbacterium sp.]
MTSALAALTLALPAASAPAQTEAPQAYEDARLSFTPNAGQTDERVRYLAQGAGYSLFFTDAQAVFSFAPGADDAVGSSGLALGLRFLGADSEALDAGARAPGTVNRLTGSGDWQSGVPTYEEIVYRELWPKIDLAVDGEGGELRYELRLHPGADPGDIRLAYAGADGLTIDADGDMVVDTSLGELTDARPVAYQDLDGRRVPVASRHALQGGDRHGFAIDGDYDRGRPLVISAALAYSTFLGAVGSESGRGVAVDRSGSAYVTGQTASSTFPTTPGAYDRTYNQNVDAFVTKFDETGSAIVYSTFVGGTAFDSGNAIAVDDEGAAYVAGFTGSTNFPTTAGAHDPTHNGGSDAFVLKLSPDGAALEYSSYLGAGGFSFDGANGIAVDDEGSAYVTGFAGGGTFPTTPGVHDGSHNGRNDVYVTKFNPSGSALAYSTFIGGTLLDTGTGIAVDREHNAYVTGFTASADFPTSPDAPDRTHNGGVNDAFVAKLDAAGSTLAYATFLGGTGSDSGLGIAVDEKGKAAHVTGSTASVDFPTTAGAFDVSYNGNGDAFATRFDRAGSSLAYSTFLGGAASDSGLGIAVDEKGKAAHVTGSTASADFPTTADAFDVSYNGDGDAFATRFDRAGSSLGYSTFLGGTASDAGLAIAVDDKGRTAFLTGSTTSSDYPTSTGAQDPSYNGTGDGILTELALRRADGVGGDGGRPADD